MLEPCPYCDTFFDSENGTLVCPNCDDGFNRDMSIMSLETSIHHLVDLPNDLLLERLSCLQGVRQTLDTLLARLEKKDE
jgi:hypothetical protein